MHAVDSPPVYLTLKELPAPDYPALVHRDYGVTLLAVDPRSTRFEIALRTTMPPEDGGLTVPEANVLRRAFGMPDVGETIDSLDMVSDVPCLLFVPAVIRLPGEPALQGGAELTRRTLADDLADELAMMAHEGGEQHERQVG